MARFSPLHVRPRAWSLRTHPLRRLADSPPPPPAGGGNAPLRRGSSMTRGNAGVRPGFSGQFAGRRGLSVAGVDAPTTEDRIRPVVTEERVVAPATADRVVVVTTLDLITVPTPSQTLIPRFA